MPSPRPFSAAGPGPGRRSVPAPGRAGGPGRRRTGTARTEPPPPTSCLWGQESSWHSRNWGEPGVPQQGRHPPPILPLWALVTASSWISCSSHLWVLLPVAPAKFKASRTLGFGVPSALIESSMRCTSSETSCCGATGRREDGHPALGGHWGCPLRVGTPVHPQEGWHSPQPHTAMPPDRASRTPMPKATLSILVSPGPLGPPKSCGHWFLHLSPLLLALPGALLRLLTLPQPPRHCQALLVYPDRHTHAQIGL